MKEKIAKWYRQGLWTAHMVRNAAAKGKLTEDEVAEILGEPETETEQRGGIS